MFSLVIFAGPLSAQSNPNALPPLAPPYGQIQPTFWELHGTALLVAAFVLMALAGASLWLILRPKPPAIVPPEIVARELLTRLRSQPETGRSLSEISQTLRRYFATVLGLPGGELTTADFCAALASNETAGAELARVISNFLRECDQRKFSPISPSAPLNAADRALAIVSEMEKQRGRTYCQK